MKLPWKASTKTAGMSAEQAAWQFLQQRGLSLVTRNFSSRRGEIDLIVKQGELLIFVEVRLRNHRHFASAAESVDRKKQRRIIATAAAYLQKYYGDRPPPCRFDVLALNTNRQAPVNGEVMANNSQQYQVEWFEDAFRPEHSF